MVVLFYSIAVLFYCSSLNTLQENYNITFLSRMKVMLMNCQLSARLSVAGCRLMIRVSL